MFRPGSLAAVALVLGACHPETAPAVRVEPAGGLARCSLRVVASFGADDALYREARGELEQARFSGGPVAVAVDTIEAGARAHVVARVPAEGPALVLPGYVEASRLPLYAARDLSIAARSIYIARGAPIVIRSARGGALRVTARFTDFPDVAADATCEDVAVGIPPPAPTPVSSKSSDERGAPHHLAREHARVFERPHGEVLADLRSSRPGPTFDVDGFKRGLKHVRYDHGIVIDAWMNAEDLEEGEGPACDRCYGVEAEARPRRVDRCGKEDADGFDEKNCPGPDAPRARAARGAAVLATPTGPSIGVLDVGTEVYVVTKSDGRVRISPTGGWFRPPAGSGFWVDASALAPP
jgi:hypothetical protein